MIRGLILRQFSKALGKRGKSKSSVTIKQGIISKL